MENRDLNQSISQEIESLSKEMQDLVELRQQLNQQLDEIAVRMHQIVGAVKTLQTLQSKMISENDEKT